MFSSGIYSSYCFCVSIYLSVSLPPSKDVSGEGEGKTITVQCVDYGTEESVKEVWELDPTYIFSYPALVGGLNNYHTFATKTLTKSLMFAVPSKRQFIKILYLTRLFNVVFSLPTTSCFYRQLTVDCTTCSQS